MARKKQDEGGGYSWMDTYGDLVTLLMCFFVMLFAMSSVNEEKWELLVRAFTKRGDESSQIVLSPDGEGTDYGQNHAIGGSNADTPVPDIDTTSLPETFDELFEYIKAYVSENGLDGSVSVEKRGDHSVYIRFEDNIFFLPDSDVIIKNSEPILEFLGDCMKNVENQIMIIRINGHTADPGIVNYKVSDRKLSTDRANSVLLYFEEKKAIDPKKLMASGYGKNFPIADNSTPEGRQKNRRVEMFIMSSEVDLQQPSEMYAMMEAMLRPEFFADNQNPKSVVIPRVEDPTHTVPSIEEELKNVENSQLPQEFQSDQKSSGGREIPFPTN